MSLMTDFISRLPPNLREQFLQLESPIRIQEYLDRLPYIAEERDRSPLNVMLDGQCHCLDGGVFAALALWQIGFTPLILDLVPDPGVDDDHVLAIYQVNGHWGAVAKSNYVGLRYREPVHRSLRELVMTYFEPFFSKYKIRTLRGYTRPMDLSHYKQRTWAWDEVVTQRLYKQFYTRKPIRIIPADIALKLHPVDERSYKSGTLGTNMDEVFPRAN